MIRTKSRAAEGSANAADSQFAACDDGIHSTANDATQTVADNVSLSPNLTDISAHLYALFAPDFVKDYPDAKIEIAFCEPEDNKLNRCRHFSAFDLEGAAKCAWAKNKNGKNVYVIPALLKGNTKKDCRANDDNALASRYAWIEYDGKGDAERVNDIIKSNCIEPELIATTGTMPHLRQHIYFQLRGGTTDMKQLLAANTALRDLFGTDNVQSPARPMRLAGTVNFPSDKKRDERSYVTELTALRKVNAQSYPIADLIRLSGSPPDDRNHFEIHADENDSKHGKNDDELIALLKRSRATPGKGWREPMLKFVGSTIGKGWSDLQIKLACGPYSDGGVNDADIEKLIKDTRRSFGKPEEGNETEAEIAGVGHNSKQKRPLHIVIAAVFIYHMKIGDGPIIRKVADLKGVEHLYRYRDGLWSLQSDRDAVRSLHASLQQILIVLGRENKSAIRLFNEAAQHILRSAEVNQDQHVTFDAHGKVPTIAGLIDPLTREIEPFKPEHFATWCLPIEYDSNAKCPFWEQLLADAFADMTDADRTTTIQLMQEVIGMSLIDNKPKALSCALVLFGGSDTGKSALLKVVVAIFGNAIATTFAELEGSHALQSFVQRLPWVLGEAFNQAGRYVSNLVKSIITGDPVSINPKNISAITKKVNTPAFWGTNHPPKFKESTGAMAGRMVIIPMTRSFDKQNPVGVAEEAHKRNPAWEPFDLVINSELPGVLNWALDGLKRALQRGHFINTEAGTALLEQTRKDANVIASFVEECVELNVHRMVSSADFYGAFRQWWIEQHGEKNIPSPTHIGLDLAALPEARFIAQNKDKFRKKDGTRYYLGVSLNDAGMAFWQIESLVQRARNGEAGSRLASSDIEVSVLVTDAWRKTEEWLLISHREEAAREARERAEKSMTP